MITFTENTVSFIPYIALKTRWCWLANAMIDEFIFPMTIHPDASGRPHALLMHERIIEHINKHEGVEWVTMAEVSDPPPFFIRNAMEADADHGKDERPFQV